MLKKIWWTFTTAKGLHGLITSEFVRTWLWPLIGTAVTAVAGYLQQFPWFHVFIGSAFVFACLTTGHLMFGVLREKRTPLNKLVFLNPQVLHFHNKIGEDGHITLSGVQFVAVFENRAGIPLSLKMEEISSVVNERVNTDRKFHNYESTIAPLTQSRFRDCSVSVDNLSGLFEGSFKFKFYYGLKGVRFIRLRKIL